MIELSMTEGTFRALIALAGGSLALLVGMFLYMLKTAKAAHVGDRWISAAGSYLRAVEACQEFDLQTDALIVQHAYRWPPGTAIVRNRVEVEKLIRRWGAVGIGGPGL